MSLEIPKWRKVLLFGDSLTQFSFALDGGWGSEIANLLQRKCDVINRGFSGYNTTLFRNLIDKIVTQDLVENPDDITTVVVFLGANDSNDPNVSPSTNQHVPLDKYEENMKFILNHLTTTCNIEKSKIITIPPPPCDSERWKKYSEYRHSLNLSGPPKTNEMTKKYYDVCRKLSDELNIFSLDIWDDLLESDCYIDGLHFTQKGSDILFEKLKPEIEKRMPKEDNLPIWKDLLSAYK